MKNVALVSFKTSNSFEEIMRMPYVTFLCFLYHLRDIEAETYNMNASATRQSRQPNNNTLYQTEPDMGKIRTFKGGV